MKRGERPDGRSSGVLAAGGRSRRSRGSFTTRWVSFALVAVALVLPAPALAQEAEGGLCKGSIPFGSTIRIKNLRPEELAGRFAFLLETVVPGQLFEDERFPARTRGLAHGRRGKGEQNDHHPCKTQWQRHSEENTRNSCMNLQYSPGSCRFHRLRWRREQQPSPVMAGLN